MHDQSIEKTFLSKGTWIKYKSNGLKRKETQLVKILETLETKRKS